MRRDAVAHLSDYTNDTIFPPFPAADDKRQVISAAGSHSCSGVSRGLLDRASTKLEWVHVSAHFDWLS